MPLPPVHLFHQGGVGGGGVPSAHATSHQNGGADEISVAGLSGVLADAQTPAAHNHNGDALATLAQLDVDNLRLNANTLSSTSGGLEAIAASGTYLLLDIPGVGTLYIKANGADRWTIDSGGKLKMVHANSRLELQGGLIVKGATSSILPPSTSDFAAGECGIHTDTNLNTRHFCWNDGGVIYKTQLT